MLELKSFFPRSEIPGLWLVIIFSLPCFLIILIQAVIFVSEYCFGFIPQASLHSGIYC